MDDFYTQEIELRNELTLFYSGKKKTLAIVFKGDIEKLLNLNLIF